MHLYQRSTALVICKEGLFSGTHMQKGDIVNILTIKTKSTESNLLSDVSCLTTSERSLSLNLVYMIANETYLFVIVEGLNVLFYFNVWMYLLW